MRLKVTYLIILLGLTLMFFLMSACPGPSAPNGQSLQGDPNNIIYEKHMAEMPETPPVKEKPKTLPNGRPDFYSTPPGNQWESTSIQDGGYFLFRERCVGCHGCRAAQCLDKYSGEGWKEVISKYGDPEKNPKAFFTQTMLQFVFYYLAYRTTKGEELDMIRNKYRIINDTGGYKYDAEQNIPSLDKDEFFGRNPKYKNYYNDK